jgi:hypothetical protein
MAARAVSSLYLIGGRGQTFGVAGLPGAVVVVTQ